MANLLPKELKQSVRKEYALRRACIAIAFLSLSTFASGAFLVPSYLLARSREKTNASRIAALERVLEAAGDKETGAAIKETQNLLSLFGNGEPFLAEDAQAFLSLRPAGVVISEIVWSTGPQGNEWAVSGSAATRNALVEYSRRLTALDRFEAKLPIGDLARERDAAFTITLRKK